MATRTRTAQQRDARELALTRPADPYRGALADPFSAVASRPADERLADEPLADDRLAVEQPAAELPRASWGTPTPVTMAGILGIVLGVTLGLFGLLLLTYISLQDQIVPDRSFYHGTDSGYVVLALVNFGASAGCGIGGIMLLAGRLTGRIAITVAGWAVLIMAAFWYLRGNVNVIVPIILAVAAALLLLLSYQRSVSRWLGVLPVPQPE